MEAVLFVGLQASGKSSFFKERFFATHVRVNLDMLKTRYRERQLIDTCLRTGQPFVVDNTNATKEQRRTYIEAAKEQGFKVSGYYFQSKVEDCKRRNDERPPEARVPLAGILGTYTKLELPGQDEAFDYLFYVRLSETGFVIEDWQK